MRTRNSKITSKPMGKGNGETFPKKLVSEQRGREGRKEMEEIDGFFFFFSLGLII